MFLENKYPLSVFSDVSRLGGKEHVLLVQNKVDGNLYVKKRFQCYNPEVYTELQRKHVKNIPQIYGVYQQEDAGNDLIIIEEYLYGSTIAELMEEGHIFCEKETIDIAMQICKILMELHGMNPPIVHRDIKPANVMIMPEGVVKLLDFSVAKAENITKKRDTVLLGTAGFAAPEQYGFSASTPQTDIYAMGVLMNLMLTRKMPSEGIAGGKLRKIISCCLEVNPKDRYRDVRELYHALKYMNEVKKEWFPLMRSQYNLLRLVGFVIGPVIIFVVIAVFFAFLESLLI